MTSPRVTQRPGKLDLAVTRGDAARVDLTFTAAGGSPLNLTGRTLAVKVTGAATADLTSSLTTTNAATGQLGVGFPASITARMTGRTFWRLVDTTNSRTLIDGEIHAAAPGQAGTNGGTTTATVVSTNDTASVEVTASVVGEPGPPGGYSQAQIEEFARDAIATALVAGSNVTITVDDGDDTITISATGGGGGGGGTGTVNVVSNVASSRILGRVATGTGDSQQLTATQVRTLLDVLTTSEVSALVAGVVGAAPSNLDTLAEIAAAIGNDANYATTVTTALAGKVAKATVPVTLTVAASDETTALTTGQKVAFRMPHAMTLTEVRATLTTASTSGNPTVDVKESGTTIFSTKVSIDSTEKTSTTAATAAVLSDTSLADDAEITILVDTAGTAAAGLKVSFIGTRAV